PFSELVPPNIDEYIAAFPDDVQEILQKIRETICKAAPRGGRIDRLWIAVTDSARSPDFLRGLQAPHRHLPCAARRREVPEGAVVLRWGQGNDPASAGSADSLPPD